MIFVKKLTISLIFLLVWKYYGRDDASNAVKEGCSLVQESSRGSDIDSGRYILFRLANELTLPKVIFIG